MTCKELEDLVKAWLMNWTKDNFGQSELVSRTSTIEAMARDMAHSTLMNDIYQIVEQGWQRLDCEAVADEMGVELTEAQKDVIVDEFMTSEQYVDRQSHVWREIIRYELGRSKDGETD